MHKLTDLSGILDAKIEDLDEDSSNLTKLSIRP